jgi:hypothetical protein
MAVAERVKMAVGEILDREGLKPPALVQDRLKRGRDRMKEDEAFNDECLAFFRGEQYSHVSSERYLVKQSTVTGQDGSGKPRHRIRRVFNLITPVIGHKVSAATSRVPGYDINPSTVDPEDQAAATLAAKVAHVGYENWDVRRVSVDTVTRALVTTGGYAWPFFDTSIGPFIVDDQGSVGIGDVRIRTFGPNEVYWEPGVSFDLSRWHAVEQARPVEEIKELPGYLEGDLAEDAQSKKGQSKLVLVTDYLERPSLKNPNGRWLTLAGGRQIVPARSYPCVNHEGKVLDEPVLHKLSFIADPESDRDMGLVKFLLDPQRSFNHANCKQAEWTQLALNPQVVVKNGKLRQKLNDIPGMVYEFWGGGDVAWRPVPQIPPELQQIKDDARQTMQFIAADQDIPSGVEAAKGIQALIERDQSVWQAFFADLAEWHSRLMRHCLYLVQRHYTEPRLLKIRGRFGSAPIRDFRGADLRGQADVTVFPGSIEPRTRKDIEAKIFAYVDRQWITPEQAMVALNGGTAESLILSYELDIERATRIISQVRQGPEVLFNQPQVVIGNEPATIPDPTGAVDPMTGQPGTVPNPQAGSPKWGPNWMPRYADNIRVWKTTFEDWFKTEEFETLEPGMQEAANQVYAALNQLEAQKQQEAAQAQQMQAEQLGMKNAAAPQNGKPMPDQAQPQGEQQQPTPNQPPGQNF